MPYVDLYKHCQALSPKIPRNVIRNKILELTGVEHVAHLRTTLDTTICRGFYLSAANKAHRLIQQHGTHLIATARGLDSSEERFVFIKEMMHLFDKLNEATDSGDNLEQLLNEFAPTKNKSPQSVAEVTCFYRALTAFCPEEKRKYYLAKRSQGHIDDYAIGLELGMPLVHVPRLFVSDFTDMVEWLFSTDI